MNNKANVDRVGDTQTITFNVTNTNRNRTQQLELLAKLEKDVMVLTEPYYKVGESTLREVKSDYASICNKNVSIIHKKLLILHYIKILKISYVSKLLTSTYLAVTSHQPQTLKKTLRSYCPYLPPTILKSRPS